MKQIFNFLFLIILISCSSVKKLIESEPKISILGSVHFPTKNVNADSIYNVLLNFKPDLILAEIDEDKMYKDFTYKNLYNENEIIAIVRYKMNHANVEIRPVDLFKRNESRKEIGLFSEASPVFQNLNKLNNENLFGAKEQEVWNKFSEYWQESEKIGNSDLKTINSKDSDKIIDSLIYYQYFRLNEIVKANELFEKNRLINAKGDTITQRKYFEIWTAFEMNRNKAIADNTLEYIKKNPNKRIIISLGFKHRFFVRKYLEEQGIKLTEFYD